MSTRTATDPNLQSEISMKLFPKLAIYIAVFTPPVLFAPFLQVQSSTTQLYLFWSVTVLALIGWWSRKQEKRTSETGPYVSSLFLCSCAMVIALIIWNYFFIHYTSSVPFTADIFRVNLRNFHAPLYGGFHHPSLKSYLYLLFCTVSLAAYLLVRGRRSIEKPGYLAPIALLFLLSIRMILTDNPSQVTAWVGHYASFAAGLHYFQDASHLLKNYTSRMGLLGVHANHYPPGIVLMLKIEESLKLKGLTRSIVLLSGVGTLWLLTKTAKLIDPARTYGALAVYLFILSPGILVYMSSDPGFIVVFLAGLILFFFLKGLMTNKPTYAVGLGLAFSLDVLFSLSSVFVALLLGIVLILLWRYKVVPFAAGMRLIGLSLTVFLITYTIIYYTTGFNLVTCLEIAKHNNMNQMSNPFDDGVRYLFRSTGAILAYLVSAGLIQSYLTISEFKKVTGREQSRSIANILAKSLIICLLVSGFSGAFFLETERIWVMFTPALVLAGAYAADVFYRNRGFGLTAALLMSSMFVALAYQLYLQPVFWP